MLDHDSRSQRLQARQDQIADRLGWDDQAHLTRD